MDAIKAFDVMTSRGFTNVDTLTAGETIYGTYYNAKTHQCVQLTSVNGRSALARSTTGSPMR